MESSYVGCRIAVPDGWVRWYARAMEAHELADIVARREASGRPYLEFITVPDLSIGLYVLAPGQPDLQSPHT